MGVRGLLALSVLALAACDRGDPAQTEAGARAEGEVLGGTISDDMIPLDQLRSQSPPLRAESTGGAAATATDSAGEAESATQPDTPAQEAEPAPSPDDED